MSAADPSRLWDGWDDPYGPSARHAFGDPQPSRPAPASGAPFIAPPSSPLPDPDGDQS